MSEFDWKKWAIKFQAREEDQKNLHECVKCKKPFVDDRIWGDKEKKDVFRQELRVCRVCMLDIRENMTPELELALRLITERNRIREVRFKLSEAFGDRIKSQRTAKRIELDNWQDDNRAHRVFAPNERPEGFVGDDENEKQACKVVFGLDLGGKDGVSGQDGMVMLPPTKIGDCQ